MTREDYTKSDKNITFKGFVDDPYEGGSVNSTFVAAINPESIKHSRVINVNTEDVSNTAFDVYQFKGYGKETIAFTLILDGTGYINSNAGSIRDQVNNLLKTVYDFQSSSHKAHYVQIVFGNTIKTKYWHCESLDVNYTLFDSSGDPLIAEVDLSFVIHRNKKKLMQGEPPFSPDVTHIHTFKEGDSLPAMCKAIYDDISYYMQIAEMNGLTNFRDIPVGKQLFFPPLINKD